MPTPLELHLYQLGVRLKQCRSLHVECTHYSTTGPEDVAVLRWVIQSLRDAFAQFALTAELSRAAAAAGKALVVASGRHWKRWARLPIEQLLKLDDEEWRCRDCLDRFENLVSDAVQSTPRASDWFRLGQQVVNGQWHDPGACPDYPEAHRRKSRTPRSKPKWLWADEKELKELLRSVKLKMEQVVPELGDEQHCATAFPQAGGKYRYWQMVEAGLVKLLESAPQTGAIEITGATAHANPPALGEPHADVVWKPLYLGLEVDHGSQEVKREGHEPISLSELPWGLLLAIGRGKNSYSSEEELRKVWVKCRIKKVPSRQIITAEVNKLKKTMDSLGVTIKNKPNVGWRFELTQDASES